MTYTILRPTFFMESWLSPEVGFDYPNAKATLYGQGHNKISWISMYNVAQMAVLAVDHPQAQNRVIELGGPVALSPLEVVDVFERVSGRTFETQFVPEPALEAQLASAADPLMQSFSALMLSYARGDVVDMQLVVKTFGLPLTTLEDYAHHALQVAV